MKTLKFLAILAGIAIIATTSCKKEETTYDVHFFVTDENDKPIKDAKITLTKKDGEKVEGEDVVEGTTKNDGFTKEALLLPAGTHTLKVIADGYKEEEVTVTVEESSVVKKVQLQLTTPPPPPVGTVTFEVKSKTNQPITGAKVTLDGVEKETTANGKVAFTDLLYKTYNFSIKAEGYNETDNHQVKVDKENTNIFISLSELPKLSTAIEFLWEVEGVEEKDYNPKKVGIKLKNGVEEGTPMAVIVKASAEKMVKITNFDVINTKKALKEAIDAGTNQNEVSVPLNGSNPNLVIGTKVGNEYFAVKISKAEFIEAETKLTLTTTWQE